jgi:hypothetical protein
METWLISILIGLVLYAYVMCFNRVTRIYRESGYTLTWSDFFTKVLPITN